jgi:hypothetical protein
VKFTGSPLSGQGMGLIPFKNDVFIFGGHKGTLVGTGDCSNEIIILKNWK